MKAPPDTANDQDLFESHHLAVLIAIRKGASVADAARSLHIGSRTVQRWLAKGRNQPQSRYASFAATVDQIRAARRMPTPAAAGEMGEYELFVRVSEACRAGSVQALRLYWRMLRARPDREPPRKPTEEL